MTCLTCGFPLPDCATDRGTYWGDCENPECPTAVELDLFDELEAA